MRKTYSCDVRVLNDEYSIEYVVNAFEVIVSKNGNSIVFPVDVFNHLMEMYNVILPLVEKSFDDKEIPF